MRREGERRGKGERRGEGERNEGRKLKGIGKTVVEVCKQSSYSWQWYG